MQWTEDVLNVGSPHESTKGGERSSAVFKATEGGNVASCKSPSEESKGHTGPDDMYHQALLQASATALYYLAISFSFFRGTCPAI